MRAPVLSQRHDRRWIRALSVAVAPVPGRGMTGLHDDVFRSSTLIHVPGLWFLALSGAIGVVTVTRGALCAVWASVRLLPAVAMNPPAPATFRRGILDTLAGAGAPLRMAMMIPRSLLRWPGRAAITHGSGKTQVVSRP